MSRRDEGKISLVEFFRSIKFNHQHGAVADQECPTHFAHFNQSARACSNEPQEENQLIRSAN